MSDNLAIWQKVEKTDPRRTKPFNRSGGFRGTATNATYQVRKATELFGPVGIGWGWEIEQEEMLTGRDETIVHKIRLRLWYKWQGQKGEVVQFGQTTFSEKRGGRDGSAGYWYTDEEAPKKSLTDALMKCLSLLGFSADVHMGLYDDHKYVAKLKREFERHDQGVPLAPIVESAPDLPGLIQAIEAAPTEAVLDEVITDEHNTQIFLAASKRDQARIYDLIDARRAALAQQVAQQAAQQPQEPPQPAGLDEVQLYDEATSKQVTQEMLGELTPINARAAESWRAAKADLAAWARKRGRDKAALRDDDKARVTAAFDATQLAIKNASAAEKEPA